MEKLRIGISKTGIMVGGERIPLLEYDNPADDPIRFYPDEIAYYDVELVDCEDIDCVTAICRDAHAVTQGDNRDNAIQMIAEAIVISVTPIEQIFTEEEAIRMQQALSETDMSEV